MKNNCIYFCIKYELAFISLQNVQLVYLQNAQILLMTDPDMGCDLNKYRHMMK